MERETKKNIHGFLPIIALILTYFLSLSYAFSLSNSQNDISYLVLSITVTLPYLIGIIITFLKLIRKDNLNDLP